MARCFSCGRIGHYSSTRHVALLKEPRKPKKKKKEHDPNPRLRTRQGKHADPMELPRSAARYLGYRAETPNNPAHLRSLMQDIWKNWQRKNGPHQNAQNEILASFLKETACHRNRIEFWRRRKKKNDYHCNKRTKEHCPPDGSENGQTAAPGGRRAEAWNIMHGNAKRISRNVNPMVPFKVAQGKLSGQRRRSIAWVRERRPRMNTRPMFLYATFPGARAQYATKPQRYLI
ncbi:uncharacterized protein TM35_000332310 [Trypanosoma theileri]|uniref:Uncharacterized protein n=1 Tax=Trypanosoma theileri TaxID=67003 RepID=A0A1X0NM07_9TRYP|nr:uncharacterized protein TM35_000332310 [Trypanosoma theileri]ORC85774.1 hypothetical protein TM35_000332310 [Trypanosoma theileri]